MKNEPKKYDNALDYYMRVLDFDKSKKPKVYPTPKYDGDVLTFKTINGQSILGEGNIEIPSKNEEDKGE